MSVCYVALSAATDVHVASLTALPYRCLALRELGQLLIQIHGQHAQLLTKSEHQNPCLMATPMKRLTQEMAVRYQLWHQSCRDGIINNRVRNAQPGELLRNTS